MSRKIILLAAVLAILTTTSVAAAAQEFHTNSLQPLPLPVEVNQLKVDTPDAIVHLFKPLGATILVMKSLEGAISTHWLLRAGQHDLAGMPAAGVTIDDGTAPIRIFAGNRLEFTVPDDVDVLTLRNTNTGALLTYWWLKGAVRSREE